MSAHPGPAADDGAAEHDEVESTSVLIVGAGPTGLTAAVRLAQLGIPYLILDARPGPTQTSNAALVHASTIELFSELGVADKLVAAGRKIQRIAMVDRERTLAHVDLTAIPSTYPFALSVPQSVTEDILLRRLAGLGGSIRRSHRVEALGQQRGGYLVTGSMETSSGPAPFAIRARYVVGADGSHSVVRPAIGLEFPGETYPSQFVLADVELRDQPFADDEATISMAAQGVTVIGRLPSGNYRLSRPSIEIPLSPRRPKGNTWTRSCANAASVRAWPPSLPGPLGSACIIVSRNDSGLGECSSRAMPRTFIALPRARG